MTPDAVVMVDWSAGNDTGPRPRRDAIWIGTAGAQAAPPLYLRNRPLAEAWLARRIEDALARGERLMIGFDFPFAYPAGFAAALTGRARPLPVWDWLAARVEDAPRGNNRFAVAAAINRRLGAGSGPFWGVAGKGVYEGLAPTKTGYANPFPDRRRCETLARGSFTCWQLAYAGAVGSQILMGMPVLSRLRARFSGQVAVWPFEPLDRPVSFVEIWPTLLDAVVRPATGPGAIRDAVQVALTARAFAALAPAHLAEMLADVPQVAAEEGWILGLGHEEALCAATKEPCT